MSPCSPRFSASDGNKNPHWGAARGKERRSGKSGRRRSEERRRRGFWRSYKEDGEEGKAEEIEVGRDKKICQWNDRQERGN